MKYAQHANYSSELHNAIAELKNLSRAVVECIDKCELDQMVDCIRMFYRAYIVISNQVLVSGGMLTKIEMQQYNQDISDIEVAMINNVKRGTTHCKLNRIIWDGK